MKTHAFLHIAAAVGLLVSGAHTAIAQRMPASVWSVITRPVSMSAPIIVDMEQLDRYGVSADPSAKVLDGAMLSLPFLDTKQPVVERMARDGALLQRPVWVMDGQKVIAEGRLVGVCIEPSLNNTNDEFGFLLGFVSLEQADKEAKLLKLEPSVDELIRRQKRMSERTLDNMRFWWAQ